VPQSHEPSDTQSTGESLVPPALVEACRRGDAAAFEQLVAAAQPHVRRLVGRLVGRSGDVDDVLQETFLRVWRGIGRFRGDSSFRTWLTRIALNAAHTWRHARRPVTGIPAEAADRMEAPSSLREDALRAGLEAALARLSPDLRATFVLHESEGHSYAEIAEILSCPIGTVMSRLHRAREQVHTALRDWIEELTP
jgi:RNA polymerase sigma-70 factor (ECF subfamily)